MRKDESSWWFNGWEDRNNGGARWPVRGFLVARRWSTGVDGATGFGEEVKRERGGCAAKREGGLAPLLVSSEREEERKKKGLFPELMEVKWRGVSRRFSGGCAVERSGGCRLICRGNGEGEREMHPRFRRWWFSGGLKRGGRRRRKMKRR
ncbi:hypothetical protein HAX54_036173 [Datura stramonium]|uniref:Uncharacterized protein n=1 Tax=Datura stramonium TaxID=4076 RepID=A0ABS8VJP5_DATST|nr:hypothetical protein [Datura stramonium]